MFKCSEINFTPEKIVENLDVLAQTYSIRTISFLRSIGLSFEITELDNDNPANRAQALNRLCEIDTFLNSARPWFTSDNECWTWFLNELLEAFSHLTPSEIVRRYQGRGINALLEWAEERNLGNFQ